MSKTVFKKLLKTLSHLEDKMMENFGELTQSPRWFTFWIIAFFIWAWAHIYLHTLIPWYDDTKDFVIVTLIFSCVPFWVENSLKRGMYTSQKILEATLNKIQEIALSQRNLLDLHIARDDAHFALVEKTVGQLHGLERIKKEHMALTIAATKTLEEVKDNKFVYMGIAEKVLAYMSTIETYLLRIETSETLDLQLTSQILDGLSEIKELLNGTK